MDPAVAELVTHTIRNEALGSARDDLRAIQQRAVEAGRDRSRRLIKTSNIDRTTGEIRYNPAGRANRDWYLHVYLNTLRYSLGQPAVTIDAHQVEDTARLLRRIGPASDPLDALRAVAVVRDIATDDAAHAGLNIVATLQSVARRRAIAAIPDTRFDADPVAVHVTRHWYQRCYDDHIQAATATRQPLTTVTDAEEHHVASVLATGIVRRLIGADGVPLMTAHDTALTEIDRRLAAGQVGVVPGVADPAHLTDPSGDLRPRVLRTWNAMSEPGRAHWAGMAEIGSSPTAAWHDIPEVDQDTLIRFYRDVHRLEYLERPFDPPELPGDPRVTAAAMFNHALPLTASDHPADLRPLEAALRPDAEDLRRAEPVTDSIEPRRNNVPGLGT